MNLAEFFLIYFFQKSFPPSSRVSTLKKRHMSKKNRGKKAKKNCKSHI